MSVDRASGFEASVSWKILTRLSGASCESSEGSTHSNKILALMLV